jgi:hypothetical protein
MILNEKLIFIMWVNPFNIVKGFTFIKGALYILHRLFYKCLLLICQNLNTDIK